MSNEESTPSMYDLANQFIDLANQLSGQDRSGTVGTAIRYAASRYNTFEASQQSDDLAKEREQIIERFTEDFRKMMGVNLDQYIEHTKKNSQLN